MVHKMRPLALSRHNQLSSKLRKKLTCINSIHNAQNGQNSFCMRRPHNMTEDLITSIANFFIFASLHCDVMIDSCLFKLFTLLFICLFSLYYVMLDSFLNVLRNNTSEVTRRSVADIVAPIAFVVYLQITKIETIP